MSDAQNYGHVLDAKLQLYFSSTQQKLHELGATFTLQSAVVNLFAATALTVEGCAISSPRERLSNIIVVRILAQSPDVVDQPCL